MKTKAGFAIITMLVLLASSLCYAQATSNTVRYENESNAVIVKVRINNKKTCFLVVDTGADITILTNDCADKIGLHRVSAKQTLPSEPQPALIGAFTIGSLTLRNRTFHVGLVPFVEVFNKRHSKLKLSGVIGMDLCQKFALGIDTLHKTLTLWSGGRISASQKRSWFAHYPIVRSNGLLTWQATSKDKANASFYIAKIPVEIPMYLDAQTEPSYTVSSYVDGVKAHLVIDTGSTLTSVTANVFAKIVPQVSMGPVKIGGYDGAVNETPFIYAQALRLGDMLIQYPLVAFMPTNPEDFDGVLGMSAFEQSRAILDFPAKKIFMIKEQSRSIIKLDKLGVFLGIPNNNAFVLYIKTGSIAEKCGLKTGDLLQQIDDPVVSKKGAVTAWKIKVKRDKDSIIEVHLKP